MDGQYRTAVRLRLAARIIGFGNASFVMSFLFGETCIAYLDAGREAFSIEGALVGMMAGLALAGCIASWWRERIAGILLIISSFLCAINIPPLPPLVPDDVGVWLIVGLPRLVAGVFFLVSYRLSRELPPV